MAYYDRLIKKWPDLGPPVVSDADVAEMRRLQVSPQPVEPTCHNGPTAGLRIMWRTAFSSLLIPMKVKFRRTHETSGDLQHRRDCHASARRVVDDFPRSEVASEARQAERRPDGARKGCHRPLHCCWRDNKGRQSLSPNEEDDLVPGKAWWAENGFRGRSRRPILRRSTRSTRKCWCEL